MDANENQENLEENVQNLEPENTETPTDNQAPAKKRRKTKGKKHQVSIKNKNRNQRNYRKEPAPVHAPEPPPEVELVVEDQVAFELEPLPNLPDKSKKFIMKLLFFHQINSN